MVTVNTTIFLASSLVAISYKSIPCNMTFLGPATQVSLSTSTVDPMPDIIQNVFCSNIGYINCANEVIDIFCGSNGKIYPNM